MILPDANLLLYAHDSTSPFHAKAKRWWEACLNGRQLVALCPVVLFAFVRIGTHPKAYNRPMTVKAATGHVQGWLQRRNTRFVAMEEADFSLAMELLARAGTGGNLTTDAQIAAVALRLHATVHSADTDFRRFPGLKLVDPINA